MRRRCSDRAFLPAITLLSGLMLVGYMGLPALAQDPPKDDHPPAHHTRLTAEEHFAQANLAHDGHLTLEEAKRGYPTVARHFHDIDADAKGYVTENDLRAWHALQKAARRLPPEAADTLRPRNAFRLSYPEKPVLNTSTNHTVAMPIDAPPEPTAAQQP